MLILERPQPSTIRLILFTKDFDTGVDMVLDIAEISLTNSRRTQNIVLNTIIEKALHSWKNNDLFDMPNAGIGWSRTSLDVPERTAAKLLIQIRAYFEGAS